MKRPVCLLLLGALASCTWRQSLLTAHDASPADAPVVDAAPIVDRALDKALPVDRASPVDRTVDRAPAPDTALAFDTAPALDTVLTLDTVPVDAAPTGDAPSVCWGRRKVDAGSGLSEGLLIWYQCESLSGTTLLDSSGHGNDGILASNADQGGKIAPGKVGNSLALLAANKGYVSMPPGLLTNACEVTVATWVYVGSTPEAWSRIWDFGVDTNRYMFMTPLTNTDDVARFTISITGNVRGEENLKPKVAVPIAKWTHVAVVLGPSGGTLYFDGEAIASDENMALRPADVGYTGHNYIGRSNFSSDPYIDVSIDEFRVYDRALTQSEIKALASGS